MSHSNKNVFHYGYNSRVPIGVHICIYYQHLNRKQMLAIKMSIDINNAENYIGCNRQALEPDRSILHGSRAFSGTQRNSEAPISLTKHSGGVLLYLAFKVPRKESQSTSGQTWLSALKTSNKKV